MQTSEMTVDEISYADVARDYLQSQFTIGDLFVGTD
jgi:hypothetical protein